MEKSKKKNFSEKKVKKPYITWDDNDMESSKDSENEEIIERNSFASCEDNVWNTYSKEIKEKYLESLKSEKNATLIYKLYSDLKYRTCERIWFI